MMQHVLLSSVNHGLLEQSSASLFALQNRTLCCAEQSGASIHKRQLPDLHEAVGAFYLKATGEVLQNKGSLDHLLAELGFKEVRLNSALTSCSPGWLAVPCCWLRFAAGLEGNIAGQPEGDHVQGDL